MEFRSDGSPVDVLAVAPLSLHLAAPDLTLVIDSDEAPSAIRGDADKGRHRGVLLGWSLAQRPYVCEKNDRPAGRAPRGGEGRERRGLPRPPRLAINPQSPLGAPGAQDEETLRLVEEGANGGDSGGRLLFHQPMP
jgi:hypothetical protein